MLKALFLCTGNSCRSQMAEGIVNHFFKNKIDAQSAGTAPTSVNPYAIEVMKEIGIDISEHASSSVDEFISDRFDFIITLCDHAKENCPYFSGSPKAVRLHMGFPDPADFGGDSGEVLKGFRQVRDDIKAQMTDFFKDKG